MKLSSENFHLVMIRFVFHSRVRAAIIPILWNVPLLSIVIMSWSTLSVAKCTLVSSVSAHRRNISWATQHAAFFSKRKSSLYEEQKPIAESVSTINLERWRWWVCALRPTCSGARTSRGRATWIIACPVLATLHGLFWLTISNLVMCEVSQECSLEQSSYNISIDGYSSEVDGTFILKSLLISLAAVLMIALFCVSLSSYFYHGFWGTCMI